MSTTLNIVASYVHAEGPTAPQHVSFGVDFAEGDEAGRDELLALFPKSTKLKASGCSTFDEETNRRFVIPTIRGSVELRSNGVNGGVNETGIKRYRSIVKHADKLGIEIVFGTRFQNAYADRAAFEQAIGS